MAVKALIVEWHVVRAGDRAVHTTGSSSYPLIRALAEGQDHRPSQNAGLDMETLMRFLVMSMQQQQHRGRQR
jgi:hypothetical protein